MIVVEMLNVSFKYKKKFVLENIDLKFQFGKIYCIVGHNGAGKTTLIRLCLNILKPTIGDININKQSSISYVPDNGGLYNFLSVRQNIEIFGLLNSFSKEYINDFMNINMRKWNMIEYENCIVKNLSAGSKQKLSLIVSDINSPDILFLDEPSNSLDISSLDTLNEYILKIKKRNGLVIITTHDVNLISKVCDNIVIINNRKIVYENDYNYSEEFKEIYKKYTSCEATT